MLKIRKINIDKFEREIYSKYQELFPELERRDLYEENFNEKGISDTYNEGIEELYEIVDDNKQVGFPY